MGAVSRDSVPQTGSFLRPKFLLLRALGVFIVQPRHTCAKTLACLVKKPGQGLQWVDLTSWEVGIQNIIVGPGTVRRVLLQKTQYHLITNAGVCSVSSEWHYVLFLYLIKTKHYFEPYNRERNV